MARELALNFALLWCSLFLVWLISIPKRDVSIIDIFWGFGFVEVAWFSFLRRAAPTWTEWLLLILTTIWGLRLTAYLGWRKRGHGEDRRYAAMRQSHGDSFVLRSLLTVFTLQAVLLWIIAMPQQWRIKDDVATWTVIVGVALWTVGFAFESIGDYQMMRFKANPDNEGKVLDSGLWRYTRHPNYFGDTLVWWGLFLIFASDGRQLWAIISPLLMTFLLLRVSGVTLLEKDLSQRKPAYADYAARTSSFIPWPPKKSNYSN